MDLDGVRNTVVLRRQVGIYHKEYHSCPQIKILCGSESHWSPLICRIWIPGANWMGKWNLYSAFPASKVKFFINTT